VCLWLLSTIMWIGLCVSVVIETSTVLSVDELAMVERISVVVNVMLSC
jgi:hypothetical protein